MTERQRILDVRGAGEHNLCDIDVTSGPALAAVVGMSGSVKSPLPFDAVYNEARPATPRVARSLTTWWGVTSAHVRSIDGLATAVALAQNVLNVKPSSTVAMSVGLHPLLRILVVGQLRRPASLRGATRHEAGPRPARSQPPSEPVAGVRVAVVVGDGQVSG